MTLDHDPHIRLRAQIRAGRELLSMTQADIAGLMDVSLSKISRAESGDTKSGDILLAVKSCLERSGIRFTPTGVERVENRLEIIEGPGCYLRLLDHAHATLRAAEGDRTLYLMFGSDRVSPAEVNDRYRRMRADGIAMRQIISAADDYVIGPLNEYRAIPAQYFTNIVTLIYGGKVAQVNGDETTIALQHDPALAARERRLFDYFWDTGTAVKKSSATERF